MSHLLTGGEILDTGSGAPCVVGRYLGSGGQGEVYECRWSGESRALKWYYPASATAAQRECLEHLVTESSPGPEFLWPEDIASSARLPGFGYLMRLREPNYRSLNALMQGRLDIGAIALIDAAIALVKALRTLHTRGFCYCDINFGNAFVDPQDGRILVCDNDNVTINRSARPGVNGTIQFMAPEVLRGALPNTVSDQHSLAVLLFHMLCMGHPLMGRRMLSIRCWDAPAQRELFAEQPVFIFDPQDESNAATRMAADPSGESGGTASLYWNLYPGHLRETFVKAFTAGLREPSARPTELEWLGALSKLRDSLFRCRCGAGNYHVPVIRNQVLLAPPPCWSCGAVPRLPMRMRIDKKIVMLNADTQLYPHHLGGAGCDYDYSQPLATVVRHPTVPDQWGLRNTGAHKWVTQLTNGVVKDVPPGLSVPLVDGTRVFFGAMEGLVRA